MTVRLRSLCTRVTFVSDIAVFVLKRDVKLQPSNQLEPLQSEQQTRQIYNQLSDVHGGRRELDADAVIN